MVVIPFQPARILQGQSQAQRLLAQHATRLAHYQELRDFYGGLHSRGRRPGRTQLVANYARAIVDKHVAYTFARGVQFQAEPTTEQALARILDEAAFNRTLLQAATNASVLGDAVLKIMWDPSMFGANSGRAGRSASPPPSAARPTGIRILNVDPGRFFPAFAADDPTRLREVTVASVITPDDAHHRYNLSLARPGELLETWSSATLQVQVGTAVVFQGINPYGFVPFVHVPNLAPPGSAFGVSDLEDVIPLNRELDERMSDQADVIRYHADPPVIFKGVREHSDLAVGPGTVWDVPSEAEVALLEWRGQPPAVDRHLDRVLRAMYDVAEAPRSSFGDTEQAFSGVALETQLQPIVQRTLRRRIVWEPALREAARFALLLAEQFELDGAAPGAYAPYRVGVHWPPMLPRDDDAEANRYIALAAASLRSHTGAMEALGVADPTAELAQIQRDRRRLQVETAATPEESGVRFIP